MSDIAIDLNPTSPTFGDVLIVNGDLVLVDGKDEIRQNVIQNLRTFLGEWFLDTTVGVPYFQQIIVKNPEPSKIDALLLQAILATPGVQQVLSYSSSIDFSTRQLTVSFRAQSTDGIVDYAGLVP